MKRENLLLKRYLIKLFLREIGVTSRILKKIRNNYDNIFLFAKGTPFQIAVWRVISGIPKGQVITYSALARQIGKPNAFRAVALACGQNPFPVIIPCHRVVGKYGLGGFSANYTSLFKIFNVKSSILLKKQLLLNEIL